jgi:prevent-host-death family protein
VTWSLHDAKNRLSQLLRQTREGPQVISVRGEERAVVLSLEAYRRLTRADADDLVGFLQSSPWAEGDLDLERPRDAPRELDLGHDGGRPEAGA